MKKILVLLFLFLFSLPSFAIQEERKISLKDAIKLALETNPQLKLAKMDIDIARNKILSANRLQNPAITTAQQLPNYGADDPQQIEASLLIELFKRGKRKETQKAYSIAIVDGERFLEHNLIAEVKKAYINLLIKKAHLKIYGEQEDLSRELYETMQKEASKGLIPQTEVIQAKIVLNRAIMFENIAKSEVVSAQNRLNTVLNTSDINYDTKEDSLTDDYEALLTTNPVEDIPSFASILDFASANRFDLLMAQKEVIAAKKNLESTKTQRIPDLELTGGYAYFSRGMNNGHWQDGAYIGASLVNIPILYNFKPEIKNAEIEIQKAELKYDDMKIDAQRNLMDAWEKFSIARNNLNFYNKEILTDSKKLIEISRKSLANKEIDLTTYLVSKKLYLELMLGYQDTLGEYYLSYAELLKEINIDSIKDKSI